MKSAKRGLAMAVAISVSAEVAGAETPVLPEVTVVDTPISGPPVEQTTPGPVKGYQALTATSATRTATPLETFHSPSRSSRCR